MECKKCNGTGWILTDNNGHMVAKKCDCKNEENIRILTTNANIPLGYKDKTVNGYEVTDKLGKELKTFAVNYVKTFSKETSSGIYIYSDAKGSGKTHMSISILQAIINTHQVTARFITLSDLFMELKSSFGNESTAQSILNKYRTTRLLVIDDIDVEKVTEWNEEMVYNIIDYREKNLLPTIYTSNCKIEDLKYNDRIKSRIKGNTTEIQAPNIDRRNNGL